MPDDESGTERGALAEILSRHIDGRKQADVARDAGLSKATLSRWLSGRSVAPYHWEGLLRLLAALELSRAQVNRALRAAGMPSIDALAAVTERRPLVARWRVHAPNNLPAELTSFVGRDDEILAIAERLSDPAVRLVTLTGPGGSGKTRLSLRVAAELLDVFRDGVTFVALADATEAGQVVPEIGAALGLAETATLSPEQRVAAWLADRHVLLILDNLEQVADCGPALTALLRAAPRLTILATSRTPLNVTGEQRWPVRPLPIPPPDLPARALAENPAVALFVERAGAADPAFRLTSATAPDVVTLCERLDGLPLAIELVAARAGDVALPDLVARVPDTLGLASDGPRDVSSRQRALRETIAWSDRLLPPPARLLFARLGVLSGFDERLAVAVGAGCDVTPDDIPSLLDLLDDASLIERLEEAGEPRYRMLATIREYALERLDDLGEREATSERLAQAMLALAEDAPPYVPQALRDGWFPRVDRERLNVDAALEWASQREDSLLLARLVAALWPYWHEYRQGVAGRRWLDTCLAVSDTLPDQTRAVLLTGACTIEVNHGDHAAAIPHATEALALWRRLGNSWGQAMVLQQLAWIAAGSGDMATTIANCEAMLEHWQLAGDPRGIALALSEVGTALMAAGQFDAALPHLLREQEVVEPTGDPLGIARARHDLGLHALLRYDAATALDHLRESVERMRSERPSFLLAASQLYLATSLCLTGRLDEAEAIYADLLRLHERTGDTLQLSLVVLGHAAVAHRRGDGTRAAWLCGAATSLLGGFGITLVPSVQAFYDREIQLVIDQIGPDAFAAAFARGAEVPPSEALAAVRDSTHDPNR